MIRILHVEDEETSHLMAKKNLMNVEKDLVFVWVESGEKALELLENESFDCILSDFQMPGMDGLEFLKTVREQGNQTPFIFLTGQGNEKIAVEAFHLGADDYFTKEEGFVHYERLLNSIKKHIHKYIGHKVFLFNSRF